MFAMQYGMQSAGSSTQCSIWTGLQGYDHREGLHDVSAVQDTCRNMLIITCRGCARPCLIVKLKISTAAAWVCACVDSAACSMGSRYL